MHGNADSSVARDYADPMQRIVTIAALLLAAAACSDPVNIDINGNGRIDQDERCAAICKCEADVAACTTSCLTNGPPAALECAEDVAQCVAQAEHDGECAPTDTCIDRTGGTLCVCRADLCAPE